MEMKIATYNIWHAQDYSLYLKGEKKINPENIARYIWENDISICALQEVDVNHKRSEFINTPGVIADYLSKKSGEKYYYEYAASILGYANEGSQYGNAIISKYPIKNVRKIKVDVGMGIKDEYEPRIFLIADVEAEDKKITVIATHFGIRESEKQLAVERLQDILKEIDGHVIFMGDLNNEPGSYIYSQISRMLVDSCSDIKLPLTFSSDNPRYKIDYIFTSADIKAKNVYTSPLKYSDHLPLCATIEIL